MTISAHNTYGIKARRSFFMSKKKKKITKLSEEQYNAYIMSLKNEPTLYNADGEMFVPESINKKEEKKDI